MSGSGSRLTGEGEEILSNELSSSPGTTIGSNAKGNVISPFSKDNSSSKMNYYTTVQGAQRYRTGM